LHIVGLAIFALARMGDWRAFHTQALAALRRSDAVVVIDQNYQQVVDTLKDYGAELPKTAGAKGLRDQAAAGIQPVPWVDQRSARFQCRSASDRR
jgi:hypothetical protein